MLGSSGDSVESRRSVHDREHEAGPDGNSDYEFRHPSFYVPINARLNSAHQQIHFWTAELGRGLSSPSSGSLGLVPEENSTPEYGHQNGPSSHTTYNRAPDSQQGSSELDTSPDTTSSALPSTIRTNARVLGPRPLPPTGVRTPILGEEVVTKAVTTGTPMTKKSHVHIKPQHAEQAADRARQSSVVAQPGAYSTTLDGPVMGLSSNKKRMSTIKRKPIRSGTSDSMESQSTPVSGKENSLLPHGADSKGPLEGHPALAVNSKHSPDLEMPPPPYISRQNTLETLNHTVSSMGPPPLPERPPALPSRPAALPQDHLDLSLGKEKLGGGVDGEQAKLGKLIIEPEGQKMLDLIVATNLLAFRRAFVAANVMGRR